MAKHEEPNPAMLALLETRVGGLDWNRIAADLAERGCAVVPPLLDPATCADLASLYAQDEAGEKALFRSRVIMQRHSFGRGEYKYFDYPLPPVVGWLRSALYPPLAEIANAWAELVGAERRFPGELDPFLAECAARGQSRPTPLLLKYEAEDYNCLHQDLYGDIVFPIQLTVALSRPDIDYTGGEFVVVEQRPRKQSRAEVVRLEQGQAVLFAVNDRPVEGTRGHYRAKLRHGVSRVRSGRRLTLGIIFHDAA